MDLLLRAEKLDPRNYLPNKHYAITNAYNFWGEADKTYYEKAYDQMQMAPQLGFFWYQFHSGVAAAGMGKNDIAQTHFDEVKKILRSSKLDDALSHHVAWNSRSYWLTTKPFLVQYGFE